MTYTRWTALGAWLLLAYQTSAATYYLDADGGNDSNSGTSQDAPWQSLSRVSSHTFQPGDQILLQRGDTFVGKLLLDDESGTEGAPILVGAYGAGDLPVINAAGYLAGVHICNAEFIEVKDLEITADAGTVLDGSSPDERYGVHVDATTGNAVRHVTLKNLYIHHIFATVDKATEGADPTTHFGYGISLSGQSDGQSAHFLVENCTIERTGHRGIRALSVNFLNIIENVLTDIGGPGIQPSRCYDVVVRGNVVTRSGSYVDNRMHGRGSGIWPWTSERVLIEKNTFRGARGRGDSCGIHIDFNCSHVVVQYNLSIENAGGFLEILGNTYNNTYRYNISINDGSRVRGATDQGSLPNDQDGNIIWLSGYQAGSPNDGPYNSYIYNNTIYVGSGTKRAFHFQENARRALIANNIFYIESPTFNGTDGNLDDYTQQMIDSMVWENNLYQRVGIVPASFPFAEDPQTIGDPLFANPGGLTPEDYIPAAVALIVDQGMEITKLPGDPLGLEVGLAVNKDFFGSPVVGLPDMGAVELTNEMPDAAFSEKPTATSSNAVTMTSVVGPTGTEYYFEETSGNFGSTDSGWQSSPTYSDDGLLPNTTYSYRVLLRDADAIEGTPSAEEMVTTPAVNPFVNPFLFVEDFSAVADPANQISPYPAETWYVLDEAEASSVAISLERLRTGWGYDQVTILYRTLVSWDTSQAYRLRGDWQIENVLDVHLGIVVGIGEFNPSTGALIRRVKGITVGNLSNPAIGAGGSIQLDLGVQEMTNAGVSTGNRIGLFIDHTGSFKPNRNDVYLVDNLRLEQTSANADSDGDGIPNTDEDLLGLDSFDPSDAGLNLDGDDFTNLQEYIMGSDLNDSSSFLKPGINLSGGNASFSLSAAQILSGRWYILEVTDDLMKWRAANAVTGSGVTGDLIFTLPAGNRGFGRFRVEWSE